MARFRKSNPIRDNLKGILVGSATALLVTATVWFFLGRGGEKSISPTTTLVDSVPYISPWAEYATELPPPHELADVDETYYNGSVDGATPVAMFQRVTGNLSASDDVDFYSFSIDVPGSVNFSFSFDGSDHGYTYLWDAAVYGTDGWTVLKSGSIPSKEGEAVTISAPDLTPGTYFLKISRASGGNPFMNGYSDTNYHIAFLPECAEHVSVIQVLTAAPTCSQAGELTSVCNICDMVLDPEPLEPLDHIWSAWETEEEISLHSPLGKRSRTCAIGGETETQTLLFHIHIPDQDQNPDENNMLGALWSFISNYSTIIGVIAVVAIVILFIIDIIHDKPYDHSIAKSTLTAIAAVAFFGKATGHPILVGVLAFIVAFCIVDAILDREFKKEVRKIERRSTSSTSSYTSYSSGGYGSSIDHSTSERSFTQGGPTGCGIGGSFCGCGSGR